MPAAVSRVWSGCFVTLGLLAPVLGAHVADLAFLVAAVLGLALVVLAQHGLGTSLALATGDLHARVRATVSCGRRPLVVAVVPVAEVRAAEARRGSVLASVGESLALFVGAVPVPLAVSRCGTRVPAAHGEGITVVGFAGVAGAEGAGGLFLFTTGLRTPVVGAVLQVRVAVPCAFLFAVVLDAVICDECQLVGDEQAIVDHDRGCIGKRVDLRDWAQNL